MRRNVSTVERCAGLLAQSLGLLERLDGALYAWAGGPVARSGVGTHLRHCLDAFGCFLAGAREGRVDYGARRRDALVERDREAAARALRGTIDALLAFDLDGETPLLVRPEGGPDEDAGGDADGADWCRSTVGRELEYLQSHTVHHYALMALLLRLRGFEPGEEFGVASSTLRHWRREAAGAR